MSGEQPSGSAMSGEQPSGSAMSSEAFSGSAMSSEQPPGSAMSSEQPPGSAMSREQPSGSAMSSEQPSGSAMSSEQPSGSAMSDLESASPLSPFEEISDEEALQIAAQPQLPPASVTLRDYVDQSETLSKLVLLGVDLSKVEQRPNVGNMLLRLDFETDIKERLFFLKEVGVEESHLGYFITKNPFILTESMENLQDRVSYLKSKKFSPTAVARMVSKAPYLLNFSVERLDNRLGFFQKELGLNVQKTMDLVTCLPRLLTGSLEPVKENLKVCQIELGFKENEVRHIVTRIPKLLTASKKKLTGIFDYLHNTMGIPHNLIVKFPQVCQIELGFKENEVRHIVTRIPKLLTASKKKLTGIFDYLHNTMGIPHNLIVKFPQALNAKLLRIKERHLFLKHLGRAQYGPAEPNYISLDRLVSLPDEVFCAEIALASLNDFEMFQKTL
ncbi:UNVERIFIED_CONTAM: hypothetical protein FKN15_014196 [Acipenser sinensis]